MHSENNRVYFHDNRVNFQHIRTLFHNTFVQNLLRILHRIWQNTINEMSENLIIFGLFIGSKENPYVLFKQI